MSDLLAGAAVADITPPVGVQMDGYGARTQPSLGVHDELMARVLVLEQGDETAVIISCDLLGMHPHVASEVRARAGAETGVRADGVVIAATHNHAGPVGLRGGMFSQLDDSLAETLVGRVCGAIEEAWLSRRPASIKHASADVATISLNRRDPEWPKDTALHVVLLDGEDGPVATLLNFACHATVLDATNLMLSGEFPGAACRLIQRETGAPCVYLNGACGDVNPVWIAQDFAGVQRAGQIVGAQALRLAAEMRALGPGQRSHNIRWDEFPEVPPLGRLVEPSLRVVRREVALPRRAFDSDDAYAARLEEIGAAREVAPAGSLEKRAATAQLTRFQAERWAAAWDRRSPARAATEVQAIRLGDGLAVMALPGEFFSETAAAIREAAPFDDVLMACYANDYLGYVVPEHAYEEGGYEPGMTSYAPGAEAIVRDAAVRLLIEVGGE
ncbi:MAG TPA: neutral/alkaline non-lysosomal ceramidase N-terminal domain-containing protein [Dehalococcoidia bacterium]